MDLSGSGIRVQLEAWVCLNYKTLVGKNLVKQQLTRNLIAGSTFTSNGQFSYSPIGVQLNGISTGKY